MGWNRSHRVSGTRQRRAVVAAGLALVGLLATSCFFGRGLDAAIAATAQFHERYNATEFGAIYASADDTFRGASGRDEFIAYVSAVHRKLGKYIDSKVTFSNVFAGVGGVRVTLRFASRFEHDDATEVFVWRPSGDTALLAGYDISSRVLVLK